jgi:hypothetical protein
LRKKRSFRCQLNSFKSPLQVQECSTSIHSNQ